VVVLAGSRQASISAAPADTSWGPAAQSTGESIGLSTKTARRCSRRRGSSVAKQKRERSANAGVRLTEETKEALAAAEKFIAEEAPYAIEGERGDTATFKVAARLFDFGLTRESAWDFLLEYNDTECIPAWDLDDLEK
jgi:hypothetical protein